MYFDNSEKDVKNIDIAALKKADKAFENVSIASPTTQEAYVYRARVNGLMEKDMAAADIMAKSYENYIKAVTEKGDVELTKPANKTKFVEAYFNLAKYTAKKDKAKANDYIAKGLAIDPVNSNLMNLQKAMK